MKMASAVLLFVIVIALGSGCGMLRAWRDIPPPGGCDRCHQTAISGDWKVTYVPAELTGADGKLSWQRSVPAAETPSPLELREVAELPCFRCHKSPDERHDSYRGRYHH